MNDKIDGLLPCIRECFRRGEIPILHGHLVTWERGLGGQADVIDDTEECVKTTGKSCHSSGGETAILLLAHLPDTPSYLLVRLLEQMELSSLTRDSGVP